MASQYDFFIAYEETYQKQAAENLYNKLCTSHSVFLDSVCLNASDNATIAILQAQSQSAITLALISSRLNNVIFANYDVAEAIKATLRNPDTHKLVPIFLDGSMDLSQHLPYALRLKKGIEVPRSGDLERVVEELKSLVGPKKSTAMTLNDVITNQTHILHNYPRGPMVEAHLVDRKIIETYAALISPYEALQIISDTNAFRREADPNDERVFGIQSIRLPPPTTVTPLHFWLDAFKEARLQGPRVLAALLMILPDEQFPTRVKILRQQLIDDLTKPEFLAYE